MPTFTDKEKQILRVLLMKVVYFTIMISTLMFLHFLIGISNLAQDHKSFLQGIDFWGTVAYISYFLLTGLWDLLKIDFFK